MPVMSSTTFDLIGKYAIEKGLPWSFRCARFAGRAKTPVDLTGSSARLEIYNALTGELITTLDDASGDIVLGGAAGTVEVALAAQVSATWSATNLRYRFFFTDSLGVDRLFMRGRLGLVDD